MIDESSVESATSIVNEVGRSAFRADSTENCGNGFGLYSDISKRLGRGSVGDVFGNVVGDGLTNEPNVAT